MNDELSRAAAQLTVDGDYSAVNVDRAGAESAARLDATDGGACVTTCCSRRSASGCGATIAKVLRDKESDVKTWLAGSGNAKVLREQTGRVVGRSVARLPVPSR